MLNLVKFSGILVFVASILSFYTYFFDASFLIYASGFFWLSFVVFFKDLKNKKFLISLLFLGFVSLCISYFKGYDIDIKKLFYINQYLLLLLVCVGFLRLIAIPKDEKLHKLPVGKSAFFKTYLGVHLFGSVINLSSFIIVADKLSKKVKLDKTQLITLTRSFSSDAFWSPFFVAFGAAITYAPKLDVWAILINGLILALISFVFTYKQLSKQRENLLNFRGYPISFETLYIPVLLAFLIIFTKYFYEDAKIILFISLYSIFLTLFILYIKKGFTKAINSFYSHIVVELPNMKSEISLFLVAGFFGISVSFLLSGFGIDLPLELFDWKMASLLLLLFLSLGLVGIHPIITFAIIGQLLSSVDNTLLAVCFLIAWSLNVSTSPFSGLNLTIAARYGIDTMEILKANLGYTIFMLFVGIGSLYILDKFA